MKKMKRFLYQNVCYKEVVNFRRIFLKKMCEIDPKYILERAIILTLNETYLRKGPEFIPATFVGTFLFDHWTVLGFIFDFVYSTISQNCRHYEVFPILCPINVASSSSCVFVLCNVI